MTASRPVERGTLIRQPAPKCGHCSTCDPTPTGRVSADELWARSQRRTRGFVHVGSSR